MSSKLDLSLDQIIAIEGSVYDIKRKAIGRQSEDSGVGDCSPPPPSLARGRGRAVDRRQHSDVAAEDHFLRQNRSRGHFDDNCGQIFVDNLKYEVNDDDLQVLFGSFGRLKRAGVNYRRDGLSMGTAFVVFESRDDALKAFRAVDGIALDGRCLRLSYVEHSPRLGVGSQLRAPAALPELKRGGQLWSEMARDYDNDGADDDMNDEIREFRAKRFKHF